MRRSRPPINGNALTLTGDDTTDNITLGVNAAGMLTHNFGGNGSRTTRTSTPSPPATQTLPSQRHDRGRRSTPAAATTRSTCPAANLADGTINGEAGDDIIVGSATTSTRSAAATATTASRASAATTIVNGDAGNDVMIWNNGDGNDINNGGAGVDETLITAGTADDNMTVKPQGAVTRFDRSNAPFAIDMETVERLTITSFSGNDTLATDPGMTMPMTIDAGSGDDTITTGDGADVDQRRRRQRHAQRRAAAATASSATAARDTMNGGEGDDTLVWNNGDGSDVMNGDGGVDRVENNLGAGDDVSTLKPENGRVRYDRINAGAVQPEHRDRRVLRAQHARRRRHAHDHRRRRRSRSSPTAARATTRSTSASGDARRDFVRGGSGADTPPSTPIDAVASTSRPSPPPSRPAGPRSRGHGTHRPRPPRSRRARPRSRSAARPAPAAARAT